MIRVAGSVGPTQLAQLFQNLGHPLPFDKLSAIMQEYDVSKSGAASLSTACLPPQQLTRLMG